MLCLKSFRRLFDPHVGKVMASVLDIVSSQHSPEDGVSQPMSLTDISRRVSEQEGEDSLARVYMEQYLRILADDRVRWVDRVGDSGGGQYQVDIRTVVSSLVESNLENIIMERFNSKSARVFR